MKTLLRHLSLVISLPLLVALAPAAEKGDVGAQLKTIVGKVNERIKAGAKSEKELSAELAQFDALFAEHQGEKTDAVAQILIMKAMLYVQVLDDSAKALPLLQQLKTDFPETSQGRKADSIIAGIEKMEAAKAIQGSLVAGSPFPDFQVKDLQGQPLSIAGHKGKVVLVDFWATWCGPCVNELPNVKAAYEKYHARGFEIIGISLDQEEAKLTGFLKEQKMTWAQFYDGKGWENELAVKYGVQSIPATFLLDGEGKVIARNLRGAALDKAVAQALAK